MTVPSNASPLVISTMKNEAPYILEWIAFHRVVGFEKFLIYTNDCEDGTVELLERLTAMGIVQHEANQVLLRGPHKSALKHAKNHALTEASDWVFVCDVDEFLNIHVGDGTVQDLIASLPEADAISVTWKLFSHNGQVEFVDQLLTEVLTDAERPLSEGGYPDRFVKTIWRGLQSQERLGLHGPVLPEAQADDFAWYQPDGRLLGEEDNKTRPRDRFAYEAAQINHYAVRSVDGYLVKRDRGRANHYREVLGAEYWQRMCRGGSRDTSIHRYLPAVREELTRLMSDRMLAKIHRDAVTWHQDKLKELRSVKAFETLRNELLELSAAGDHLREFEPPEDAAETDDLLQASQPSKRKIRKLLAELRELVERVEPVEAASQATRRLDEIETGLFSPTRFEKAGQDQD